MHPPQIWDCRPTLRRVDSQTPPDRQKGEETTDTSQQPTRRAGKGIALDSGTQNRSVIAKGLANHIIIGFGRPKCNHKRHISPPYFSRNRRKNQPQRSDKLEKKDN
ncbi:hypothetical protein [Thermopirellula anaerolimosa]